MIKKDPINIHLIKEGLTRENAQVVRDKFGLDGVDDLSLIEDKEIDNLENLNIQQKSLLRTICQTHKSPDTYPLITYMRK